MRGRAGGHGFAVWARVHALYFGRTGDARVPLCHGYVGVNQSGAKAGGGMARLWMMARPPMRATRGAASGDMSTETAWRADVGVAGCRSSSTTAAT